jgi:hypothetical protein
MTAWWLGREDSNHQMANERNSLASTKWPLSLANVMQLDCEASLRFNLLANPRFKVSLFHANVLMS